MHAGGHVAPRGAAGWEAREAGRNSDRFVQEDWSVKISVNCERHSDRAESGEDVRAWQKCVSGESNLLLFVCGMTFKGFAQPQQASQQRQCMRKTTGGEHRHGRSKPLTLLVQDAC